MRTTGTIINSTHTSLQLYLEPGIHKSKITIYGIAYNLDSFDRPSIPYEISYSKPRLDRIIFGETLQTATITNTFDAQGKFMLQGPV